MKTLAELFEHTLKDVYYAENAIAKALPKVSSAVKKCSVENEPREHLAETKGQIKTLEKVFKTIGVKPAGEKCDATDGLLKEAVGYFCRSARCCLGTPEPSNIMKLPLWLSARMGKGSRK